MFITPQSGAAYDKYQVFKSRRQSRKSIKAEGSRLQWAQDEGASCFKRKWEGSGWKGQNEKKSWDQEVDMANFGLKECEGGEAKRQKSQSVGGRVTGKHGERKREEEEDLEGEMYTDLWEIWDVTLIYSNLLWSKTKETKPKKKKGGIKCKRKKKWKKKTTTGESLLHAVAKSTKTTETNKQKYQTCWLRVQSAQWMTWWVDNDKSEWPMREERSWCATDVQWRHDDTLKTTAAKVSESDRWQRPLKAQPARPLPDSTWHHIEKDVRLFNSIYARVHFLFSLFFLFSCDTSLHCLHTKWRSTSDKMEPGCSKDVLRTCILILCLVL